MFNSSKTQCIFIGNRQLLSHISQNTIVNFIGNVINPGKYVKTWEFTSIDICMLFAVHINELNKKMMSILIFVSRMSEKLDTKSRIMVI